MVVVLQQQSVRGHVEKRRSKEKVGDVSAESHEAKRRVVVVLDRGHRTIRASVEVRYGREHTLAVAVICLLGHVRVTKVPGDRKYDQEEKQQVHSEEYSGYSRQILANVDVVTCRALCHVVRPAKDNRPRNVPVEPHKTRHGLRRRSKWVVITIRSPAKC